MIEEKTTNEKEMIENIINSTDSAIMALTQMEQNLIRGRFKEGAAAYDAMCKTLVGQRIWSSNKDNNKVNSNFRKISKSAKNIIDMLSPYVNSLEKISTIDGEIVFEDTEANEVASSISDKENSSGNIDDNNLVFNIIEKSTKKQISYTKLRTKLGWDRKRLDTVLDKLATIENSISISTVGSRKMIIAN